MDRLVSIPQEELPVLRDLYKVDWPKHLVAYQTINHYILWLEIDPNIKNLHIWSLNGSWRTNGTFIIKEHFDIHFATLEKNNESLVRALCLVDWSPGFLICAFMEYQRPSILKAIEKVKVPVIYDAGYKYFTLDKDKAKNLNDIPLDDITIKRLTVKDAAIANDLWPYKKEGSLIFLQISAKYNMCLGAYSSNNDLIGWIFIATSGAVGTLHVIEEYRGRKIAQALVVKICQYIGRSLQLDVHAFITHDNVPSQKLFEKLGFLENTEQGYWILTQPFKTH
ncbi:uncharacterized protein DMENIID0001_151880 [Sergentomyia squamirostris]